MEEGDSSDVFDKMHQVNAERIKKLEIQREAQRRNQEVSELKEAIFKPNLTKTKKNNEKLLKKNYSIDKGKKSSQDSTIIGSQTHRNRPTNNDPGKENIHKVENN